MARVFTTSFNFNHQQYNAIVTDLTQGNQLNFNVRLLDADLHHFFPDGTISFSGTDGYQQVAEVADGKSSRCHQNAPMIS
jgi:hypothetical protein